MTKKQYKKLMKKKKVTATDLALKFSCSLQSVNLVIWGVTRKGKIKEAMDNFLVEVR